MWSDQKASGYKRWRQANGKDPNSEITFSEILLEYVNDKKLYWKLYKWVCK